MRLAAFVAAALVLGGCVTQTVEAPSVEGGAGTVVEKGDPRTRARLHTELASLYYGRGSMGVALEELRLAVAADPGFAAAHNMYGVVYMELRENELARASFQRALALAPSDPDINHNYGWFLCQTEQEKDSIKYFLQAVRNPLYATPARSYVAAGTCSLRADSLKEAEDYFGRALEIDPDQPASLLNLGQIHYRQGNVADARKFVSRYNKVAPPTAESLWLALRVERRLGERTAEQSYANQLRRRFPASKEYQALQRGNFD